MRDDVRVSAGTAGLLGLAEVRMDVVPTTAYLLLGERCAMRCAFCSQARDSHAPEEYLSRVSWPLFLRRDVVLALADAFSQGKVRRCCLQVTASRDSFGQTLSLLREIRSVSQVPVDSSLLLREVGEAEMLFDAGLDHVGFGLDAANARVFRGVKGGSWERIWALIKTTARRFPGRVAAHLIVGLGESEREVLSTIQDLHDMGVIVALFAFTPVQGTRLANQSPPALGSYRRLQSARWLIVHNAARVADFTYDPDGRLRSLSRSGWQELLSDGDAFQTCGCPDCNRPFYNERPGGAMYNYPRHLTTEEARMALNECEFGR